MFNKVSAKDSRFFSFKEQSQGISLVGLVIGMGLSSIILLGLIQMFVGMSFSAKLLRSHSELNDAANFVKQNMKAVISQAGYTGVIPVAEPADPDLWFEMFSDGSDLKFLESSTPSGLQAIDIYFNGSSDPKDEIKHCDGTLANSSYSGQYSGYYISELDQSGGTKFPMDLVCKSSTDGTNVTEFKILDGLVHTFRLFYGENEGGTTPINKYTQIATQANYNGLNDYARFVKSVKVVLILRSREEVLSENTEKEFPLPYGEDPIEINNPGDKYIYKYITFSVPLIHRPVY